jgi:hypothetical protein
MPHFTKPIAAIAAAAAITALAGPAMAQQASFCDGNLKANSFYSNVQSNGSTANVEYHGQIQNQDPQRRIISATVVRLQPWGAFTFVRFIGNFELKAYEQQDVNLLTIHTRSPSGQGAPSAQEVGRRLRIVCQYRM